MMENSIYSVLSPEGFALILWKDSKRAGEAARVMKITAAELKELGVVDKIIPEEEPAGPETFEKIQAILERELDGFLKDSARKSGEELAAERYERFRRF